MPAPKMLLHPADPHTGAVAEEGLARRLQAIGLIGAPLPLAEGVFYPAGERFLQLVTFLGCSPAIALTPPQDPVERQRASDAGRFCHVFLSTGSRLQLRRDPGAQPPRCPGCRTPQPDWEHALPTWQSGAPAPAWSCSACGWRGRLSDLQLRKDTGLARTFVEIRGIYPAEAVPGPVLLDTLADLTGGRWATLYLRE